MKTPLDVVDETKILGVIVRSDLSWISNSNYICRKAYSRMWILRRLKTFGVQTEDLLVVYCTQIRCLLEYAVPVWNSGLTKHEINQQERVQKCALAIIFGDDIYSSYSNSLVITNQTTLS